jgi:hypothetical protein
MLEPVRYYLANRQFQHSLLNYNVLELDDRAFDWSGSLKFRYEYHQGRTLSTEVFRRPPSPAAGLDYTSWLFQAIAEFHQFLETHDSAALGRFVGHARRLLDRSISMDGWRAIPKFARVTGYGNHQVPWISCHSQGWALSVFCRAYHVTGEGRFLDAARGVMRSFAIDVEAGGIRDREKTGRLFFEEYPFPGRVRHVLNGFVTALFGIHEFGRATGDREAWNIFDEGASTLCDEVLDTFDAGHTTRYDQMTGRPGPASCLYTKVHARQLAVLHRLTGKPHLLSRARRWQHYTMNPGDRFLLGVECLEYRIANAPRYARDLCRRWGAVLQENRAGLGHSHRI